MEKKMVAHKTAIIIPIIIIASLGTVKKHPSQEYEEILWQLLRL